MYSRLYIAFYVYSSTMTLSIKNYDTCLDTEGSTGEVEVYATAVDANRFARECFGSPRHFVCDRRS